MRAVAIVAAVAAVLLLWGWGASVGWQRAPWSRDDGCGQVTVRADPRPLVLGPIASSYSSGKAHSAAEAEDQLLSPSPSAPLQTRITAADIARLRAVLSTMDSLPRGPDLVRVAPGGAKLLFASKCD